MFSCRETPEPEPEPEQTALAFPEAQGGAAEVSGGRGGTVYFVTSLDDDVNKPGTLRYALSQNVARIIIFRVSGRIALKQELRIKYGNLTIAGQTAPGDGICLSGFPVVIDKVNNVIVRFIRFRMGDENKVEGDALSVYNSTGVMIDHCSFSWSTDECVSCYGNTNFTLQYCFITESLRNSVHLKGNHGYGGIWGGTNATFHHNLLAHHDSRNPRFDHDYVNNTCHGPVDFVNNVVYNWGGNSGYGGESVSEPRKINMRDNYYKYGPATNSSRRSRIVNPTTRCTNCTASGVVTPGLFYVADNYVYANSTVTNDNWKGVEPDDSSQKQKCKSTSPFAMNNEVSAQTAEEAFETVLSKAGCSLVRDEADRHVVQDVRDGSSSCIGSNGSTGGLIDSQTDAGGWQEYRTYDVPEDKDQDGIADEWETKNGLDPTSAADADAKTLNAPYTNLDVYLNSLVEHLY